MIETTVSLHVPPTTQLHGSQLSSVHTPLTEERDLHIQRISQVLLARMGFRPIPVQALIPAIYVRDQRPIHILDQPTGTGKTTVSLLCGVLKAAVVIPRAHGVFDSYDNSAVTHRVVVIRVPPTLALQWETRIRALDAACAHIPLPGRLRIELIKNPTRALALDDGLDGPGLLVGGARVRIVLITDKNKQDPRYTYALMSGVYCVEDGAGGRVVTLAEILNAMRFSAHTQYTRNRRRHIHNGIISMGPALAQLRPVQEGVHQIHQALSVNANAARAAILLLDEAHLCQSESTEFYPAVANVLLISATMYACTSVSRPGDRRIMRNPRSLRRLICDGVPYILTADLIILLRDALADSLAGGTLTTLRAHVSRPFGFLDDDAAVAATLATTSVFSEFVRSIRESTGIKLDAHGLGTVEAGVVDHGWLTDAFETHTMTLKKQLRSPTLSLPVHEHRRVSLERMLTRTRAIVDELSGAPTQQCGICMTSFGPNLSPALTSCCLQRTICGTCLGIWRNRTRTCPLCRRGFVPVHLGKSGPAPTAAPAVFPDAAELVEAARATSPLNALRTIMRTTIGTPTFESLFTRLISTLALYAAQHGTLHILVATPVADAQLVLARLLDHMPNVHARELMLVGGAKRDASGFVVASARPVTSARQTRTIREFTDAPANCLSVLYTVQRALTSTTDGLDLTALDGVFLYAGASGNDSVMHQTSGRLARLSRCGARELFMVHLVNS